MRRSLSVVRRTETPRASPTAKLRTRRKRTKQQKILRRRRTNLASLQTRAPSLSKRAVDRPAGRTASQTTAKPTAAAKL